MAWSSCGSKEAAFENAFINVPTFLKSPYHRAYMLL
jgi:hypothetical protein